MNDTHLSLLTRRLATIALAATGLIHILHSQAVAQAPAGGDGSQQADGENVRLIRTGLLGQRLEAGPSGRFAALFGQQAPDDLGDMSFRSARGLQVSGTPTHVAIVDLENLKTLAIRAVDGEPEQVLVDGKYVFWKPKAVNVVNRLSLESGPKLEQLPLREAVEQMFFVGDDRLAVVVGEQRQARIHVYGRKSLKQLPDEELSRPVFRGSTRGYGVGSWLGDGEFHLQPMILDLQAGKIKCLADWFPLVPTLAPDAMPTSTLANVGFGDTWWRRRYANTEVRSMRGGATLYRLPSQTWCVSPTLPLCADLVVSGSNYRNASHVLELRDVMYGKLVARAELPVEGPSSVPQHGMQFSGKKVLAAMYDKLLVYAIDPQSLENVSEPFRLLHPVLSVGSTQRPAEFRLQVRGGEPPYRFTLQKPIEGVDIDEATGRIRIDFPAVWKHALRQVATAAQRSFQMVDPHIARSAPNATIEGVFEDATGVQVPQGLYPATVPLNLAATDNSGQTDQVFALAVVMVPKDKLDAANALAAKARAAKQAQLAAERQARQPSGVGEDGLIKRVNELEARLRRIEAQLDTILRKLDESKP